MSSYRGNNIHSMIPKHKGLVLVGGFKPVDNADYEKIPISVSISPEHIPTIMDAIRDISSVYLHDSYLTFLDMDEGWQEKTKKSTIHMSVSRNEILNFSFLDKTGNSVHLNIPTEKFKRDLPSCLVVT